MKKIGYFFVFLLFVSHTMAQAPKMEGLSSALATNENLIKNMVSSAIVVIDQSYRVKNDSTGQIYNAREKDNFSSIASIGWRINNAIVFSNKVLSPWETDPAFARYKFFFTPVRYQTYCYTLSDTSMKKQWSENVHIDTLQSKLLYQYKTNLLGEKGLMVDASKGIKRGYMVWVMASDSLRLDSLSVVVEEKDLLIKSESLYSVTTPLDDKFKSMLYSHSSNKIIVGGAFVVPDFGTVGTVTLKVSAIAVKVKDTWQLSTSFPLSVAETLSPVKDVNALEPVKPKESELTPVESQNDAKASPSNDDNKKGKSISTRSMRGKKNCKK